jgi:GH15 family glucan-1,4-alpha-glucosidase
MTISFARHQFPLFGLPAPVRLGGICILILGGGIRSSGSDRCPDVGPWTEAVKRSLITLKALTYAPTGGIVAAATTSLPEQLGGVRNWDYRYCWLRDATFTILALMKLGYHEEARAWRDWLVRAVAGSPRQVQIMYGVGGVRRDNQDENPYCLTQKCSRG